MQAFVLGVAAKVKMTFTFAAALVILD